MKTRCLRVKPGYLDAITTIYAVRIARSGPDLTFGLNVTSLLEVTSLIGDVIDPLAYFRCFIFRVFLGLWVYRSKPYAFPFSIPSTPCNASCRYDSSLSKSLLGHSHSTIEGLVSSNETSSVDEDTTWDTSDLIELFVTESSPALWEGLAGLEGILGD